MKPKLLIFDLDDTLLDTTGILIPIARTLAFEKRIREPLPLLPGALENLQFLAKKYDLALLTQGRTDAQQLKVQALGIASYFKAQFFADPSRNESKAQMFLRIQKQWNISSHEMLSIGNRRMTDIREAKKMGAQTCLFKYGEHQNEVIEIPEDQPDFEVDHHRDLIRICLL